MASRGVEGCVEASRARGVEGSRANDEGTFSASDGYPTVRAPVGPGKVTGKENSGNQECIQDVGQLGVRAAT